MAEYRIDELARAAGATVRNIRAYQDSGLLPPPRREGRVGIYTDVHLARLRLIGQLLSRGYTFATISELVSAWEQGRDLGQLLGLADEVASPWSDEVPDYITTDGLREIAGSQLTPEALDRLVGLGILEPEGVDRFRVPSPRLLSTGAQLVELGIPLTEVLELSAHIFGDIDDVARRFVSTFVNHLVELHGKEWVPSDQEIPEVSALLGQVRPLAKSSVEAILSHALERHVEAALGDHLSRILPDGTPPTPSDGQPGPSNA